MVNVLVSILINNYNYGRFLRDAIDSALGQTYSHCEVIVVDDGSTDDSREIIQSYGSRIISIFKENGGAASTYNVGIPKSKGEIIMFLDSDDYLMPAAAERIVSVWNDSVKIVHHRLTVVDPKGNEIGHWPNSWEPLDSGDVVPIMLKRGLYSHPPTSGLAYDRRILERLLPITPEGDFRICADAWFFMQSPFLAPIRAVDEPLCRYRLHGKNNWGTSPLSRLSSRKRIEDVVKVRELNKALIMKCAAARGLPFDTTDWENNFSLRWKLIVMRLGSIPSSPHIRKDLMLQILQKIKISHLSFLAAIQERIIVVLVWRGPRFILRVLFPHIFASS